MRPKFLAVRPCQALLQPADPTRILRRKSRRIHMLAASVDFVIGVDSHVAAVVRASLRPSWPLRP
jgi:hypothetical protein